MSKKSSKKIIGWVLLVLVAIIVTAAICYSIGFMEGVILVVTSIVIGYIIILAINLISES